MSDTQKIENAKNWLMLADMQDSESTWKNSSSIFQSAIEIDDWRKSLQTARSPLGMTVSRIIESVEPLVNPDGAPDGNYAKLVFKSSFESKQQAQETITLVEDGDGQWRIAGYYIK